MSHVYSNFSILISDQSDMEVLRTLKPNTEIENVKTDEQTQKHVDEVE